MMDSLIQQAVTTATQTHAIAFGECALSATGDLFAAQFPGSRVLIVADENTFAAAGEPVVASLLAAGVAFVEPPFLFPGTPTLYSSYDNVEVLREHLRPLTDTVVCSIASGTLNDIAKLASGELDRPYMNVCTAASVDGYASFGASISVDGFKITRDCAAPAAIVADIGVMAAAPARLTATGYGDLIEKVPAGADWILADELGIEPIDPYVWGLVQGTLRDALAFPDRIAAKDRTEIAKLAEANIMSGLAMQAMESSRPASGAGHQFSHVWEMEGHGLDWEPPLSHGFKVGIGTIASCAIWEATLALDLKQLDVDRVVASAPSTEELQRRCRQLLRPTIAEAALPQILAKHLAGETLRARVELIVEHWPEICRRSAPQLLAPQEVMDRLWAVGAPHHPSLIGMDWERFRMTHFKVPLIRSRYTVLDVLSDLGVYEDVVEGLFSASGFWGRHTTPEA
jgi:glycerol-1-phosphate dehydrogenase [NAD(P)+]